MNQNVKTKDFELEGSWSEKVAQGLGATQWGQKKYLPVGICQTT